MSVLDGAAHAMVEIMRVHTIAYLCDDASKQVVPSSVSLAQPESTAPAAQRADDKKAQDGAAAAAAGGAAPAVLLPSCDNGHRMITSGDLFREWTCNGCGTVRGIEVLFVDIFGAFT